MTRFLSALVLVTWVGAGSTTWAESGIAELQRLIDEGRYAEAEAAGRRLLQATEVDSGPDSLPAAAVLDRLVFALVKGGKDAAPETLALAQRSLEIRTRLVGDSDPELAHGLYTLALVHYMRADYDAARPLFERCLRIRESTLGSDHRLTLYALGSLANLVAETGDYLRARELYEEALARGERSLSATDRIRFLNNLATVLADLVDFERSSETYRRALRLAEETHGPDHPDVAAILDNLAEDLPEIGRGEEARVLHERALQIRETTLGPDHRLVAMSLTNLGTLLVQQNQAARARPMLERALRIREASLGRDHPVVAITLMALGDLLFDQGDRAGAREYHERALQIRELRLGPDHPHVGRSLVRLARLDAADGRGGPALERARRAWAIASDQIVRGAPLLSEREALSLARLLASGLDVLLELAVTRPASPASGVAPPAVTSAWDALIRSRAIVLDEMALRHRAVLVLDRPDVVRLARDLAAARGRLAFLLVRGPQGSDSPGYEEAVRQALADVDGVERELAERSSAYRGERARARAGLSEVGEALPIDSALVGFAHYRAHPSTTGGVSPDSYVAFVLRHDQVVPRVIPLGPAAQLETLIEAWRLQVISPPRTPGDLVAYDRAAAALRHAIWDPLAAALGPARRVFIVPDGALHQVSFATLPADTHRYLVEAGPELHYLSAERDLLVSDTADRSAVQLLVVGGPDFEGPPGIAAKGEETVSPAATSGAPSYYRGPLPDCVSFRSLSFAPLPDSIAEADEVEALFRRARGAGPDGHGEILKLTGRDAGEAVFKSTAPGRSVLHVATHGFWFPDSCTGAAAGPPGASGRGAPTLAVPSAARAPLLLSGLALAGANRRNELQDPAHGEDGILTAEEVATLDLRAASWVVLSACRTGLGPVHEGEGVFGLQRAFRIAGAGTLILSLWPVSDRDTRDWMRELYTARLGGADTPSSMSSASRRVLDVRGRAGASSHPFFWGAFVASGDWR